MPNWKKVITSGSNAVVNNLSGSGVLNISASETPAQPYKVLVQDITTGRVYYTGSYSSGGGGADNLGNHTATEELNLDGNRIKGVTDISASGNITASGNISASGDVLATNVSASELIISNPSHTGNLRFFQDSANSYQLKSNIGTIFDFGDTNVITTAQRIDGTRGMIIKTLEESDLIKFRDFDTNDIIVVDNSGSLTLGNTSAHEPHVTINTDLTASGNISASKTVFANRIEIGNKDDRGSGTRLVINKNSSARAIIEFPASSSTTENDNGFIRHTELSQDNGRMEFCVSDQNGTNDVFGFGHASSGDPNNPLIAAVTFTARGLVRTSGSIQAGAHGDTAGANITSTGFISSNTNITASNNIEAGGNISASGHLIASLSLDDSNHKTVMYDTSSGKFFFTGSYGGGGGGGGSAFTGFVLQGDGGSAQAIASGDAVIIAGGTNINTQASADDTVTVNLDNSIFLTSGGLFLSGGLHDWGEQNDHNSTSGFRVVSDTNQAFTHVTPQYFKEKYAVIGVPARTTNTLASFPNNHLVYGPSGIFVNTGIVEDDGHVKPHSAGGKDNIGISVVQISGDLEIRPTQSLDGGGNSPGIRIAAGDPSGSVDPGIFFYNRDNTSNDSSSFFYSSASAEIRFDTGSNALKFFAGSTVEDLKEVLHISKSGDNPRIGVGLSEPIKAFDFKEVRDDNKGAEILVRGSRTTTGAVINDEVGRVNFAIDSASFNKIDTSGSAATIVALVDDVDESGIQGSLSLRAAAGKVLEPVQRIKIVGQGNTNIELTGSAAFTSDINIGGAIKSLSGDITASNNISASGTILAEDYLLPIAGGALKTKNNGEAIGISPDNIDLGFGGSWQLEIRKDEGVVLYDLANVSSLLYKDFRIEGNSDTHLFFVTGGDARIGIGTSTPNEKLTVGGNISASGNFIGTEITASGNISSSGTISGSFLHIVNRATIADDLRVGGTLSTAGGIIHTDDVNTQISFNTGTVGISANDTSVFSSTVTGSVLPNIHQHIFDTSSVALGANSAIGDIVKFGGSSTVAGGLYYLKPDGTWGLAQANAGGTATSSLAFAVGSNSTTDGMCLRGFVNPFTDPGAGIGNPVYISDTNPGRIISSAPDSNGDIVRIIGHQFGTDLIYFNPSNDFIVHG